VNRWKRESPDTLLLMHAHNRWSRLNDYLMGAAKDLGIPMCLRVYPNHHDGSCDKEWLVPAGTKERVLVLAYDRQRADWCKPDTTWGLSDLPGAP
jgi:hypothetical protein